MNQPLKCSMALWLLSLTLGSSFLRVLGSEDFPLSIQSLACTSTILLVVNVDAITPGEASITAEAGDGSRSDLLESLRLALVPSEWISATVTQVLKWDEAGETPIPGGHIRVGFSGIAWSALSPGHTYLLSPGRNLDGSLVIVDTDRGALDFGSRVGQHVRLFDNRSSRSVAFSIDALSTEITAVLRTPPSCSELPKSVPYESERRDLR